MINTGHKLIDPNPHHVPIIDPNPKPIHVPILAVSKEGDT